MTDKRVFLTAKEALSLFPKGAKDVHTFVNPGGMLIGADWGFGSVKKELKAALKIEIGGDMCRRMGHGLVIWRSDTDLVFVAVDDVALGKLLEQKGGR